MTGTEQAEQIITEGMAWPYSYKTRYAAAVAALDACAYNIALDVTSGQEITEGQRARFAALDAIVKAEIAKVVSA